MIETNEHFPKTTRKKYLMIIAGLSLFCIIAFPLITKTGGYDMNRGWVVHNKAENFKNALSTFLFGIPIISFIFGLLVALFPYRQLSYRKKYLRASLLTWLSMDSLFSIGIVQILLMTLAGWYPPKNGSEKIFPGKAIKEQTAATFISEMKSLSDSANFYLDVALADHKAGKSNIEITQKVKSKVLFFQDEINKRSKAFYRDASDAGLSKEEYEQAFEKVKQYMQPIAEKYSQLKADSVDLN
jgi:hypothetical protein